jgi:uncharacterized glyoxalase superfamily protein PhnB
MNDEAQTHPTFWPQVFYKDAKAALSWLERAFGFETTLVIEGQDAGIRAHLKFGDGEVAIGSEWEGARQPRRSPLSVGGANTQDLEVKIDGGIDAHCERARAAGASIVQEPEDQFYGSRTYRAVDPEGHEWTFAQALGAVSNDEAIAARPDLHFERRR